MKAATVVRTPLERGQGIGSIHRRRNRFRIATAMVGLVILLSYGCGDPLTNALFEEDILYLQALPSETLYAETPDQASSGAARPAPSAACSQESDPCDPDLLRQFTIQTARSLNEYIYNLLSLLDKIRRLEPTERTESSRVWGPLLVPNSDVYVRLEVSRGTSMFSYVLTLSHDPTQMVDVVLGGFYLPGSTADDGAGKFGYSFSVHHDYFPDDVKVDGTMDVSYSTFGKEVYVEAQLVDIGKSGEEPVDASYAYDAPGDGSGLFFFSQTVELHAPEDGEPQLPEQASIWSGWETDGWGRADIRYHGGNLGDTVASGVECWNPAQSPVYAAMVGCTFDPSAWDTTLCIETSVGWNEDPAATISP